MSIARIIFFLLFIPVMALRAQGDVVVTVESTTPVTCGDGSDGTITVSVTGGVGSYNYLLLRSTTPVEYAGSVASSTYTFTGHERYSHYLVIVSDEDEDNGDGYAFEIVIGGPDPISITSYSATDITCNGFNDGIITVNAEGEGGNLLYTLTGPDPQDNTTGTFTGLSGGDHTVTVTDLDGCPSSDATPALTIINPSQVQVALDQSTDITCFGDNTGSISITASGGIPSGAGSGYTYSWTGPSGYSSTSEDISGLYAGDYSVEAYDANMCASAPMPVTLSQPPQITATLIATSDVSCNGGTDGWAQMTPGGGVGGYYYSWVGQTSGFTSSDQNPINMPADTYDLTLGDGNGCELTFTGFATINQPDPITVSVTGTTDVSCNGGSDGIASITVSGGTPAYTFSWTGAVSGYSSAQEDPTGMPADDYTLQITDANTCVQNFPALLTISEPAPINVVLDASSDVSCNGGADGSASITVSGGTPAYTILWTGNTTAYSSGTEDPADLPADTYDLLITDSNGCTDFHDDYLVIGEPAPVGVNIDLVTQVDCNGDFTGAIDITPTGGTAPFTFDWTGPNGFTSTSEDISALEAGDYTVTAYDANMCASAPTQVTISQSPLITVTLLNTNDVSCPGGNDGKARINPSGGVGTFTYLWEGQNTGFTATDRNPNNLLADTYDLTLTDGIGCSKLFPDLATINEPDPITVNVTGTTDVSCNGGSNGTASITVSGGTPAYTFNWTGAVSGYSSAQEDPTGMPADDYTLQITDANTCVQNFPALLTISEPAPINVVLDASSDVSCNGGADGSASITVSGGTPAYTILWTGNTTAYSSGTEDPADLPADTYDLLITDSNGCTDFHDDYLVIGEPAAVGVNIDLVTQVDCNGDFSGAIDITPTGGTAPFTFDWTGPNGFTSTIEDISALEAGDYTVTVYDANMCASAPTQVTVSQPPLITAILVATSDVSCNGGTDGWAQMTPGGGVGGYYYSWVGQTSGFTSSDQNPINMPADTYDLTLGDGNGCELTFTGFATINQPDPITVSVTGTTDVSCNGGSDGTASITVSGGTPAFTFNWTGAVSAYSSAQKDPTGMPADDYTLQITDANTCVQIFPALLTISEPAPISVVLDASSDVSCNGGADGSASITVSGGTPAYTILWTGNTTAYSSGTEDPGDLPADTYDLLITDSNGCTDFHDDYLVIGEPAVVGVIIDGITSIECSGAFTGAIDITPTGGTPPYNFAWTGPNAYTSTDEDITGLEAGDYSLRITDSQGCFTDFPDVATVATNNPITAAFVITDVSCASALIPPDGAIDLTPGGGAGGYSFDWTGPTGTNYTTEDLNNIISGDYDLTITDALGCTGDFTTYVGSAAAIIATATSTDIDCFGDADGTIDLNASGGTGTLVFDWTGPGSFTSANEDLTNLGPGTYSVSITDDNLCTISFPDIATINENPEITATAIAQDISCNGYGDGSIDLTPAGGIGPYTFAWSEAGGFSSTSKDISGLEAGSYDVRITDALGCSVDFPGIAQIDEPAPIIASIVTENNVLCQGDSTGSVEIDVIGGTAPLLFEWTNASSQVVSSDEDPFDLPAGTFTLTITDANGCQQSFPDLATLTEPAALDLALILGEPSCNGGNDATISATASGGLAAYQYALDGGVFQASGDFSGLSAGAHTVSLMDASGCTLDSTFNIGEPAVITILAETSVDISCNGANDGSITITASGGTPPHTFTLNPGAIPSVDGIFTGLTPGIYTVDVNDAKGCGPATGSALEILEPSALIIDSIQTADLTCNAAGDGSISMYVSGGTAPYMYSIDTTVSWQADSVFSGLQAGDYEIYIADARLCQIQSGSITLGEPPALSIDSIFTIDIQDCAGDSTGDIRAYGSGGTGLLYYSLDGITYQDSGHFVSLPAGSHTLTLMDETGCYITEEVILTEPEAITATILTVDVSPGNLGSISITNVSGGTAPYDYSIDGGLSFSNETDYPDLESGIYQLVIRDAIGCTHEEAVIILDFILLQVDLDIQNVSCFGADDGSIEFLPVDAEGPVEYSIDGGNSFVDDPLFGNLEGRTTYYLVAIDSVGKIFNDTVEITEPMPMIVNWSSTPALCNAFSETGSIDVTVSGGAGNYTFAWSDGSSEEDRTGVNAGNYGLEILDENNCSWSDTLLVNSIFRVTADAGKDTTICAGDTMRLDGTAIYTPIWSPSEFFADPDTIDPLITGLTETTTFVLTVTEEETTGCYNMDSVTIDVHPYTGIDVNPDTFIVRGGTAELLAEGVNLSSYSWDPSESLDNPNIPDPLASPNESTTFTVTALNEYGCEESNSIFVEVIYGVKAYNVFTPGGDGINDYFEIENGHRFPDMQLEVYSRWGDLLYSARGYDESNLWDGYARGQRVPTGTYYYVIIPFPGAKPVTGTVTVIWSDNE